VCFGVEHAAHPFLPLSFFSPQTRLFCSGPLFFVPFLDILNSKLVPYVPPPSLLRVLSSLLPTGISLHTSHRSSPFGLATLQFSTLSHTPPLDPRFEPPTFLFELVLICTSFVHFFIFILLKHCPRALSGCFFTCRNASEQACHELTPDDALPLQLPKENEKQQPSFSTTSPS